MTIQVSIRRAREEDARCVAQLKQLAWPEEAVSEARIAEVLASPHHAVFVADAAGTLAGFVDGFSTLSAAGILRWEVDLLAVHPAWRGRQLGQALVEACLAFGEQLGAHFSRALIQVENAASQVTFERCGFECDPQVLRLFVARCVPGQAAAPGPDGYLVVNTMQYRGIWLEEDRSPDACAQAEKACQHAGLDLAGVLVNPSDLVDNGEMENLGFKRIDDYHWWRRPFKASAAAK